MEIYLAHTQGFCAGVARAIEIVDRVLEKYGPPLYVFHEIVHNKSVVANFEKKGVRFIDALEDAPDGARLIFSAHGVSPAIVTMARQKKLQVIDATCPLVGRIHLRALELSKEGIDVVLIGHKNHQEVIGTQGYVDPLRLHIIYDQESARDLKVPVEKKIGFVTQTTLSLDDTRSIVATLKERYPHLIVPSSSDICYATQNRQDAVKELCQRCDLIIVCGSVNSSNSQRLKETAEKYKIPAILIDKADELNLEALKGVKRVGISSGASVPKYIVEDVIAKIKEHFSISKIYVSESPEKNIKFSLPKI
jgi:4-hydroxy-3-methylbut-2-enyl diphosphate reductase